MSGGSSGLTAARAAGETGMKSGLTGLQTGVGQAVKSATPIVEKTLTEGVGEGVTSAMKNVTPGNIQLPPTLPTNTGEKVGGMSDVMKSALITGGLGAGAGLATGLASALMAEDPKQQEGHAALPSGSPGSVKGTAGTQMSFGRSNLPQNKDYALAMLQGRRF